MSSLAIRTEKLSKSFGSHHALVDLDLDVPVGVVFGFLGPNGAGKTTTIRLLLDLLRPTAGSGHVLGHDVHADARQVHARVGYLPGDLAFPPRVTGREYLDDVCAMRSALAPKGRHSFGQRFRATRVELAERFHADLSRPIQDLSLGNQRKIALLTALSHEPELAILDEPTRGLDPLVQATFHEVLREVVGQGRTVFLSSHVLDEVQHSADHIAVLRDGRLRAVDTVEALLSHVPRTVTATFAQAPSEAQMAGLRGVRGVTEATVLDQSVHCKLAGPAGALLAECAAIGLVDLRLTEPHLDEVFLDLYRDDTVSLDAEQAR